jgi:hypothetical protein
MTTDEILQLKESIKETVRGEFEKFTETIKGDIELQLKPVNERLDALWEQVVKLTEDMTQVQETQDFHTKILRKLKTTLNERSAILINHGIVLERLDSRLETVEDKLKINVPSELTLLK